MQAFSPEPSFWAKDRQPDNMMDEAAALIESMLFCFPKEREKNAENILHFAVLNDSTENPCQLSLSII